MQAGVLGVMPLQRIERRKGLTEAIGRISSSGSLPEMVRRTVEERQNKPALAEKVDGRWRELSFGGLYEKVGRFAGGLSSLGVERGSKVALMSTNCLRWTISDLAIQSLGAATVPIFPTLGTEAVSHILKDAGVDVIVVEDGEKARTVRDTGLSLTRIIVIDDSESEVGAARFSDVEEAGSEFDASEWEDGFLALDRDQTATIIYTSGTSGLQKGVVLTHGNILSNLEAILEVVPVGEEDVGLSVLPLSHVLERTASQFLNLAGGGTNYFAESIEKVPDNIIEVRPTVMLCVPRLLERVYGRVREQATANPRKARIFEGAVEAAKARYETDAAGRSPGMAQRLRLGLYDRLVFRKIREKMGGRLRFFVSGGARLEPAVGMFFYGAGIPVVEGYGLTETSPVISVNLLDDIRFGTVGSPLSNVELGFSEEGEIAVRGPSVAARYHNLPEENAASFDEDGWFYTGDIGELDEAGRLKVTDRAKSIMVLSTGKNVAPQPIESALANAPHIAQAMLVGDGRQFVSALVVPDFAAVRRTLEEEPSAEDMCADERVEDLIRTEMESACEGFDAHERPKKLALLPREWSEEGGEMTPTLKLKTNRIFSQNESTIQRLYE